MNDPFDTIAFAVTTMFSSVSNAANANFDLLVRIRNQDDAAFEEFERANFKRLFAVAFAMLKNSAEAEDVVQETFFRFYQSRDDIRSAQGTAVNDYVVPCDAPQALGPRLAVATLLNHSVSSTEGASASSVLLRVRHLWQAILLSRKRDTKGERFPPQLLRWPTELQPFDASAPSTAFVYGFTASAVALESTAGTQIGEYSFRILSSPLDGSASTRNKEMFKHLQFGGTRSANSHEARRVSVRRQATDHSACLVMRYLAATGRDIAAGTASHGASGHNLCWRTS